MQAHCKLGNPYLKQYPIQRVTEIYNKVTEIYKKVTELEISSWNVPSLLRSEVAYIGTGHILS
jgi:hypothetical protein